MKARIAPGGVSINTDQLDDKDRRILSLLERGNDLSQTEIANELDISQPSVGIRLKRLREKGAVSFLVGVNFRKIDLYLAKVEITARDSNEIIRSFRGCPYFVNGFVVSGQMNLTILLMGEDLVTLESIVDTHIRSNPGVSEVNLDVVIAPVKDLVLPVKMDLEKREDPPCGSDGSCSDCIYYQDNRCLGCPITGHYRGIFW